MGITVMLSLDLERGVSEEQRNVFNEGLKKRNWFKIPKVTTTWSAKFADGVTSSAAQSETKTDVAAAASEAKIKNYEAVMHLGPEAPTSFNSQ